MTRDMMKRIKKNKENAALLVRYANPKSKSKPTEEEVLEILYRHIPYCGTRPAIKSFTVSRFNRNKIIKCAYFVVELDNGKTYEISAYQDLKGRTPEQKEEDKTADYPSGLFTIFHTEIKAPEKEPEQVTEKETAENPENESVKIHGFYSLANCACLEVHIEEGYDPFIMWRLSIVDNEKPQKWHKAKIYDTAKGRQYFKYGKIKIYLDEVMRV